MATLLDLYNRFLDEKECYCSQATLAYYRDNVMSFLQFLSKFEKKEVDELMPDVLSRDTMVKYLSFLRRRNIKNTSVNTYFRAVKCFNSWLCSEDYTDRNFCAGIKSPRPDSDVKIPLTCVEVYRIDSSFDLDTFLGLRNYCIFHLMLDCGLRRGEVVRLTLDSFDFSLNVIYVDGKGSKKRVVPLPDFLKQLLRLYDSKYCAGTEDSFFCNNHGDPLSSNCIRLFIYRLSGNLGIDRLHPHLLRHTFATSYILGGGNLEFLRLLLGHSDYDITRNYLHLANTAMVLHQSVYPLDSVFFQSMY